MVQVIAVQTQTPPPFPVLPTLPAGISSLGTCAYLLENSRLGLAPLVPVWEPAFLVRNQQNALGLRADVRQTRVRSRCTGKEQDAETGLDYFGARYFSGALGRFTSPDTPLIDQPPSDPQSWNLYSYAQNNPLKFTDPNGRWCIFGKIGTTCSSGDKPDVSSTVSYPEQPIDNPAFYAVVQGVNDAAPVVNALGNTLVTGAEFAT